MWNPKLSWDDFPDKPKYQALADVIENAINRGELEPNEKLPTHRYLADVLGVTVGTITRGYAEAEKRKLLKSRVGSGTFVRDNSPESTPDERNFVMRLRKHPGMFDLGYSMVLEDHQAALCAQELDEIRRDTSLLDELLAYHAEYGIDRHRAMGAKWFRECGFEAVSDQQVLVTTGAQHGFFSVLMALAEAGDVVATEGLTYPGFVSAARHLGLTLAGLEYDDQGILPDHLDALCRRQRPRALYVMTRMSNPSCHHYSIERIDALVRICQRWNLVVIEDDVQGCMGPVDRPSFYSRYPDHTVVISSISKVLAGGLRVGYIASPTRYFSPVASALRTTNWITPPLTVEIATRWIEKGIHLDMRDRHRSRLAIRHQIIDDCFGHQVAHDPFGLNGWLSLPPPWRAIEFAEQAERKGVLVKPAELFATGQFSAPQCVRFSIGGVLSDDELEKALRILSSLLSEQPFQPFTI